MEKARLVKRIKGTGKVISTEMTANFRDLINSIENKVEGDIKLKIGKCI